MDTQLLEETVNAIVAPGKGILAADESTPTMGSRLSQVGAENTENNRRDFRELLFTTEGMEENISGVILFDETLRQQSAGGGLLTNNLIKKGVIPGIKVDKGAKNLANTSNEKITEGLDGLRDRLNEYFELGARFDKWRAVITIGEGTPTDYCIDTNAHALARYSALSQEAGLVPIVEPEVLMTGSHSIETCYEVTKKTLNSTFAELRAQGVHLPGILLKPNMVISALDCPTQAGPDEVAEQTINCFRECVPSDVHGIVFLSGGQTSIEATNHLSRMNSMGTHPWELSFSYGRALQHDPLMIWNGSNENRTIAQETFLKRAKLNGLARYGNYNIDME